MQTLSLTSHIGPDGILRLEIPTEVSDTEIDITVTIQPVPTLSSPIDVAPTHLDGSAGRQAHVQDAPQTQTYSFRTCSGLDGRVCLEVPAGLPDTEIQVQLVSELPLSMSPTPRNASQEWWNVFLKPGVMVVMHPVVLASTNDASITPNYRADVPTDTQSPLSQVPFYRRFAQFSLSQTMVLVLLYALLGCVWLWTKDGITVDIAVQKDGEELTVLLDGQPVLQAQDPTQETRVISVTFRYQDLESPYFYNTSLPQEVNNIPLPAGLSSSVHIPVQNPYNVTLTFIGKDSSYFVNITPYRHISTILVDPDDILQEDVVIRPEIHPIKGIQWILGVVFKPFVLIGGIFVLIVLYRRWWYDVVPPQQPHRLFRLLWMPVVIGTGVLSVFYSLYLMAAFTEFVPHVPDSISYLLLARLMARGQLVLPYTQLPSFIPAELIPDYFNHWYVHKDTYMIVPYLTGHPLLLAVGQFFDAVYVVPPLIGAAVLALVFFLTYRLTRAGSFACMAMLLCFASPFFRTQTVDYMSHNTASLYLLLAITPLFFSSERLYLLSGFFLGMLLNTRPLTAVAVVGALGIHLLLNLLPLAKSRIPALFLSPAAEEPPISASPASSSLPVLLKRIGFMLAGLLPSLALYLYYNWVTTGDLLSSPYIYHYILDSVGFGQKFKIGYGLLHGFSNIVVFSLFFLKDYYISFFPFLLSLLLLPFFKKSLHIVLILQSTIVLVIAAWCFYDGSYFMYGPRLIYEALPVFTVLYGITFYYLWNIVRSVPYRLYILLVLLVYSWNVALGGLQWLGLRTPDYTGIMDVPARMTELKQFNYADGRFYRIYKRYKGENKVFLMRYNPDSWWTWGEGMWMNDIPLTRSRPLFLPEIENNPYPIPDAVRIDWDEEQ